MLRYLRRDITWSEWISSANDVPRRWRLAACAFCRRIWHLLNRYEREIVEISERLADGEQTDWRRRYKRISDRSHDHHIGNAVVMTLTYPAAAADVAGRARIAAARKRGAPFPSPLKMEMRKTGLQEESAAQALLIRDIFGNPFRSVEADDRWLTAEVRELAQTIYEHRAFHRVHEIGDHLAQAGCRNEEILSHCSDFESDHVRGCWVVDLIRGNGS